MLIRRANVDWIPLAIKQLSQCRNACLILAYVSNRYVWLAAQQGQGLLVPDFLQSRVSRPCFTHRMATFSRKGWGGFFPQSLSNQIFIMNSILFYFIVKFDQDL